MRVAEDGRRAELLGFLDEHGVLTSALDLTPEVLDRWLGVLRASLDELAR